MIRIGVLYRSSRLARPRSFRFVGIFGATGIVAVAYQVFVEFISSWSLEAVERSPVVVLHGWIDNEVRGIVLDVPFFFGTDRIVLSFGVVIASAFAVLITDHAEMSGTR